jgi:hypothetical protein
VSTETEMGAETFFFEALDCIHGIGGHGQQQGIGGRGTEGQRQRGEVSFKVCQ